MATALSPISLRTASCSGTSLRRSKPDARQRSNTMLLVDRFGASPPIASSYGLPLANWERPCRDDSSNSQSSFVTTYDTTPPTPFTTEENSNTLPSVTTARVISQGLSGSKDPLRQAQTPKTCASSPCARECSSSTHTQAGTVVVSTSGVKKPCRLCKV
jgi:hypothetical protein